MTQDGTAPPPGGPYDWYRRGVDLLDAGDAAAAATLLARAAAAEPTSASVLEALGRAEYGAGRAADAARTFASLVQREPAADYARFGLGSALARIGRFVEAEKELAMAVTMQPARPEYVQRLREVRATLSARAALEDRATSPDPAPGVRGQG